MRPGFTLPLKVNRLLGAQLVEYGLVKASHLAQANTLFLQKLKEGDLRSTSLLKILVYDIQCLDEASMRSFEIEEFGLGYCRLQAYEVASIWGKSYSRDDCWATWSIPFDSVEGFHFVSTAYYLSPAVRHFWEAQLDGELIWYTTDLMNLMSVLDTFEEGAAEPLAETAG